jgi:hypothetical protein
MDTFKIKIDTCYAPDEIVNIRARSCALMVRSAAVSAPLVFQASVELFVGLPHQQLALAGEL